MILKIVLVHTDLLSKLCHLRNNEEVSVFPGQSTNAQYRFCKSQQFTVSLVSLQNREPKLAVPGTSFLVPVWLYLQWQSSDAYAAAVSFLIRIHRSTNIGRQNITAMGSAGAKTKKVLARKSRKS